ncbi:modification methylase HemK [Aulographum hederae CBS 113979]|uniref:Modification methylase HemK n=1 Tax=Aulographum hederae CBS 113979 TaxID=1176131 RepID=A0A6G1HAM3_9PEZI|nr:modification methylase HemK [Aulographum hederae CBS 113979]
MPRISPSALRQARAISPLLPQLLRPCRELQSAQNELRWLREHAVKVASTKQWPQWHSYLQVLCRKRGKGVPLQYLLGSEYFGDLEIICKPGVLIPRPETAASVTFLVERLTEKGHQLPGELRVLDLCTGTGCIPLLFRHEFSRRSSTRLRLMGVDISRAAVELALQNQGRLETPPRVYTAFSFHQADVLSPNLSNPSASCPPLFEVLNDQGHMQWDILISNPPYISPQSFFRDTARSVRNFEPHLALVPPSSPIVPDEEKGDPFYPRLLEIAEKLNVKVVLFEVADLQQADRVAEMAQRGGIWKGIEIWRDEPSAPSHQNETGHVQFPTLGRGNGRSVFCWRDAAKSWLGAAARAA